MNVLFSRINNFNSEFASLSLSLNISEHKLTKLAYVVMKIASSYFVRCDFSGELVGEISELFLSGTTVADIEFNTEILMRTTWVVRSSENESTNAIQLQVEIEMSDICGYSGS
jgi:hypothetical protein